MSYHGHKIIRDQDGTLRHESLSESECLNYDPFQGDESEVVTLSDSLVVGRKDYAHCNICHGPIAKGERHRALSQINRELGQRKTWRFCNACCVAMAALNDDYDDGTPPDAMLIERYVLGDARRFQEKGN